MQNGLVHTSPVLFDQSITIKESFKLQPNRKKNIVITEQGNESEVTEFLAEMKQKDIGYELVEASDLEAMVSFLKKQTMGTQLYIVSTWDTAMVIFEAAVIAGFTEDEIETMIIGKKKRYVYCMKCFERHEVNLDAKETQCPSCDAMLEVGPFFSKVRKGNIGYPFKPV